MSILINSKMQIAPSVHARQKVFATNTKFLATLKKIRSFATTGESMKWWSASIFALTENNPAIATLLMSDKTMRDAFLAAATSSEFLDGSAVLTWCKAVANLVLLTDVKEACFDWEEVRDAICNPMVVDAIHDEDVLRGWGSAMNDILRQCDPESVKLFNCTVVLDAFLKTSKFATSSVSVLSWCISFNAIIPKTVEERKRLTTVEFRDALVQMSSNIETASAAEYWSTAVASLCNRGSETSTIYGTAEVRDAFVRIAPFAKTPFSVRWLCTGLLNVITFDANVARREIFATAEMRSTFILTSAFIGGVDDASLLWSSALCSIVSMSEHAAKIFSTHAMMEACHYVLVRLRTECEEAHQLLLGCIRHLNPREIRAFNAKMSLCVEFTRVAPSALPKFIKQRRGPGRKDS